MTVSCWLLKFESFLVVSADFKYLFGTRIFNANLICVELNSPVYIMASS